jgi:hypothetical protein
MAGGDDRRRRGLGVSRRSFLQGAAGGAAFVAGGRILGWEKEAQAALGCPNNNVIAQENRCTDPATWTTDFALSGFNGLVAGFAASNSVNRGQPVPLKLTSYSGAATSATILVYRLGYYGGRGGRLVYQQNGVALPVQLAPAPDAAYGLSSCAAWTTSATVPASATAVSGVYLVKIRANNGFENHIPFIVRDDSRRRDLLVAMPTNTWQAYNNWNGKSLYVYNSTGPGIGGTQTLAGKYPEAGATGRSRALKVSFDRPYANVFSDYNWVLRTEFPLIYWLEQQGYDIAYTEDVAVHSNGAQLLPSSTKTYVITGHSEYWTDEMFNNVQAARDAGTNIASFSANAAYWKVRYEDATRTLVCFKTVQGNEVTVPGQAPGNPTLGVNDFGPGATQPERLPTVPPNDPLGLDKLGHTADDKPQFCSTTFRDPGAVSGSPTAPNDPMVRGQGRTGPNRPENTLFGVLYVGDNDIASYSLTVPAASGGEFAGHPAWRHTTVAGSGAAVNIGNNFVGWEWDAVPNPASPLYGPWAARQPGAVKRLAQTDPVALGRGVELEYLTDVGHTYSASPPTGQGPAVHAVTYRAGSGAQVFASGTMQWSWGLAPHFLDVLGDNYSDPPVDSSDPRIQQATYNVLADSGVQPSTPDGIILDSNPQPPPPNPPPPPLPPPPPDVVPPKLVISRRAVRVNADGFATIRLRCPADEVQGVFGTVRLVSVKRVPGRLLGLRRGRKVEFGRADFQLLAGRTLKLKIRVSRRRRRLLRRLGSTRVEVIARVSDMSGNDATRRAKITLRPPRRRRAARG